MLISFYSSELLLIFIKQKPVLIHMKRRFSMLGKLSKCLLTYLRVHLQNITYLLVASSSRQLLIAVVTHFLFHYPDLRYSMYPLSSFRLWDLRWPFCLKCFFFKKNCNPVIAICPVSSTIRCSHAPRKINRSDIRLYTDGQSARQTLTLHAGIVEVAVIALHHLTT